MYVQVPTNYIDLNQTNHSASTLKQFINAVLGNIIEN